MKKRLLGYYDYTVILTYCGMLFAFTGILKVINENYNAAIFCLMAAGICDMFDGAVASTKERNKSEKCFGIQIDSLSDLISFGVLPSIFVYMITGHGRFATIASGLYALAALIRLAYFNVLEAERQEQTSEKRSSYLGVPVTTIALLLPLIYIIFEEQIIGSVLLFVIAILVTAIGFLLPVQIKKPKLVGKILLIVIGLLEVVGMIFLVGWGML